jgi:hypothetical protein
MGVLIMQDQEDGKVAAQPALPGILVHDGPVSTANARTDAPTIYADGIQGAMLSPLTVKMSFIEHFVIEGDPSITGRYVLNLVVPTPQLRAIADLFTRLAGDIEQVVAGNG